MIHQDSSFYSFSYLFASSSNFNFKLLTSNFSWVATMNFQSSGGNSRDGDPAKGKEKEKEKGKGKASSADGDDGSGSGSKSGQHKAKKKAKGTKETKETKTGGLQEFPSFSLLPFELQLEVFKNLDYATLVSVSRVSKTFLSLSRDDSLWSSLCRGEG